MLCYFPFLVLYLRLRLHLHIDLRWIICEELDDFRTRPMLCLCCIAALYLWLYLCLYLCLRLRLCNGRPSTAAHISPHMDSLARRVYVLTLTAEQMRKRSMTS
jgi:hypothetical protein